MRLLRPFLEIVLVLTLVALDVDGQSLHATLVAADLDRPTQVTAARGDARRLFVTRQDGVVQVILDGSLLPTPFLDISAESPPIGDRGLFALAFHPHYAQNGRFYTSFADANGASVVRGYHVSADPNIADAASGVDVFGPMAHPGALHYGGQIQFGPDGMLYLSLGDGMQPYDAQSTASYLGKILRMDVDAPAPHVPTDNPFASPNDGALDLVWASGLRNPWRLSFDRRSGDLWIGDVGSSVREEIDFQPASHGLPGDSAYFGGRNYGWPCVEGTQCTVATCSCSQPNFVSPIAEIAHTPGASAAVIGGFVYRGDAIPSLRGAYVYGDYVSGRILSLRWNGTSAYDEHDLTAQLAPPIQNHGAWLTSFGEDANGELYFVTSFVTSPLVGQLYRIDPGAAPCPCAIPYCLASANSVHSSTSGSSCISSNDLVLIASGAAPGTYGVFVKGDQPMRVAFAGGLSCVAPPVTRFAFSTANSAGVTSTSVLAQAPGSGISAGSTKYFQFFYRASVPGNSAASDALSVTFGP